MYKREAVRTYKGHEREGRSYKRSNAGKGLSAFVAETMAKRNPQTTAKSKFAKELAKKRKRRNPEVDLSKAEEMSRTFHGREPKEEIEVDETETFDDAMTVLGDLVELTAYDQSEITNITFSRDEPSLCSSGDGENLEFIGGDQSLDVSTSKAVITIGYAVFIAYRTDKHHLEDSNGEVEEYGHFFGEEFYKSQGYEQKRHESQEDFLQRLFSDGLVDEAIEQKLLPTLSYKVIDGKLLLVGGSYTIEDVGIRN